MRATRPEAFIAFVGFGSADAQTSSSELPEQEGL
jgi:hypothetical protein